MKILKIEKSILLKILNIFNYLLTNKDIIKNLNNFLFKKKENIIYFIYNNSNIQIKIKFKLKKNDKNILIWISIKDFLSIIKLFPNREIFLKISKDNFLIIKSLNIEYKLKTFFELEYPIMKLKIKKFDIKIKRIDFLNLINYVSFSVDKESNNYSINGIMLLIKQNKIKAISTDNYRLSIFYISINENFKKPIKIIIPLKTIILIKNIIEKENFDIINIKLGKKEIKFIFKNIEIISKLIEDNFPILKSKLYKNYKYNFLININELKLALKRSYNIINKKFKSVKFLVKEKILKILTESENKIGKEIILIKSNSKEIELNLNLNYIIELLENIKYKDVIFNFNEDLKNIIITIPNLNNFKHIMTTLKN